MKLLAATRSGKVRTWVLVGICAVLAVVGVAHYARTWYHERQLTQLAYSIIDDTNCEDPLPLSEFGPEADVEIQVTCSYKYLLFGDMTGKITLTALPRPHAPIRERVGISYIYAYDNGAWKSVESYGEH